MEVGLVKALQGLKLIKVFKFRAFKACMVSGLRQPLRFEDYQSSQGFKLLKLVWFWAYNSTSRFRVDQNTRGLLSRLTLGVYPQGLHLGITSRLIFGDYFQGLFSRLSLKAYAWSLCVKC